LLLDELYKKVVELQDKAEIKSFSDLLLHNNQTAKLKKCNISDNTDLPALA
jgi:predicted CopG family antitoxin